MATGPEHYRRAEELLARDGPLTGEALATAQVHATLALAAAAGTDPPGLALSRFSVIYATPPCVITPRSPVQGSRAVPELLCLTRPYVPKARTLT